MQRDRALVEVGKCFRSAAYFIGEYCMVEDATVGEWVRFDLWPEQRATLRKVNDSRLTVILKARQLGLTWLVLGYALWRMMFRPSATTLLFSRRDDEAVHLLDDRLKGMWKRVPEWLRNGMDVVESNDHEWQLSNGSIARAFPTSAGDSYTATLAIVDEADLVPDLNRLMRAVKPTIDAGGQMVLLSRADKSNPQSEFKQIYRGAKAGDSGWCPVFLPWSVRPSRTAEWYEAQKSDVMARTGSLDDLHEQYPATDAEALAPRSLDKRIPPQWLEANYREMEGGGSRTARTTDMRAAPSVPGLKVYVWPRSDMTVVAGVDPAEGNPTSDDSAATFMDAKTGEEVASLAGKIQPSTLASYVDLVGQWYNGASILVERNNHGHAVLLWMKDNAKCRVLNGLDGKPGWLDNSRGKALLYATCADAFRDNETTVHSFETFTQLASIEGSSLRAPQGEHDDRADGYALACVARGLVEQLRPKAARSRQG